MHLPSPPLLKTTIIQLNKDIDPEDNNYEILTNEYSKNGSTPLSSSLSLSISEDQPRKKRRRSSSFVDEEELVRRRNETKQLHLIIEKRRRIKINREFEALKYLIPACRNTDTSAKRANCNSNKIDGMYKLTILKSAVEYILYLHHIVQQQHALLAPMPQYDYDVAYLTVPLDVNQYRNIDKEFDFAELARTELTRADSRDKINSKKTDGKSKCEPIFEHDEEEKYSRVHPRAKSDSYALCKAQLPTPDVTPDIAPILLLLSKYSGDAQQFIAQEVKKRVVPEKLDKPDIDALNQAFSFDSVHKSGLILLSTSPFTVPIKSLVKKAAFYLPDSALSVSSSSLSSTTELPTLPKKMYFKTRVPPSNLVASVEDELDGDALEDASKVLLTLRKPSIDHLLN